MSLWNGAVSLELFFYPFHLNNKTIEFVTKINNLLRTIRRNEWTREFIHFVNYILNFYITIYLFIKRLKLQKRKRDLICYFPIWKN